MPFNDNDHDMEAPVTRRELREELADFERRLDEKFEQKFEQKLAPVWREIAEFRAEVAQKFAGVSREIAQLSLELARHANAISEQLRAEFRALGEALPPRVDRLEERVFATPAPKRTHRPKRRTPAK